MHENHASIVALHRLKTFFKKSADTFASTQYYPDLKFLHYKLLKNSQNRMNEVSDNFMISKR